MFAVIRTGGKQYRVTADEVIKIDKIAGAPGEMIQFGEVLVVGGDNITLGSPTVSGAAVAGEVIEQGRDPTIVAFKKRRRQNSRRKRGHRQEFTRVRITEILTEGRQPSIPAKAKAKPESAAADDAQTAFLETDVPAEAEESKPKAKTKPKSDAKPKAQAKPKSEAEPKTQKAPVKPKGPMAKGKSERSRDKK